MTGPAMQARGEVCPLVHSVLQAQPRASGLELWKDKPDLARVEFIVWLITVSP